MAIDVIFPRPVFETVDAEDVCNRARLRDACLEIAARPAVKDRQHDAFHRVTSSLPVDDQLHRSASFAALAEYVTRCGTLFADALGFPGWGVDIDRMWTNVGKPGDFLYPHAHVGEAFIAGVYYVSCDPRDGITFHHDVSRPSPAESNPLNYTTYYYDGQEGRLLMFRTETQHSTFPQQGDERISVSFTLTLAAPR